jgi:F-type H+-transporting ATPase subunit epsilon
MSDKTFHLQVFTQERRALDAEASSLVVPASDGEMGVLANHAPMMALLGEGRMKVRAADGEEKLYRISGGFLEVHANKATVLTDRLGPYYETSAAGEES